MADTELLFSHFTDFEQECERCLAGSLPRAAYDYVLKCSHVFNLLDARGVISVTDRTGYIARVRNLARRCAEMYLKGAVRGTRVGMNASGARDFLLEIGTEELPAAAAQQAASQAGAITLKIFAARSVPLETGQLSVWVTPRRIAILVSSLTEMQQDREIVERGPVKDSAYDAEGNPTKAASGFARAKGIPVEQLEIREHEGREFVFAVRREEGAPVAGLLPEICAEILKSFSFLQDHEVGRQRAQLFPPGALADRQVRRGHHLVRIVRHHQRRRKPGAPFSGPPAGDDRFRRIPTPLNWRRAASSSTRRSAAASSSTAWRPPPGI